MADIKAQLDEGTVISEAMKLKVLEIQSNIGSEMWVDPAETTKAKQLGLQQQKPEASPQSELPPLIMKTAATLQTHRSNFLFPIIEDKSDLSDSQIFDEEANPTSADETLLHHSQLDLDGVYEA